MVNLDETSRFVYSAYLVVDSQYQVALGKSPLPRSRVILNPLAPLPFNRTASYCCSFARFIVIWTEALVSVTLCAIFRLGASML